MTVGFVRYHPDHKKIWVYSSKSLASGAIVRDVRWGDYLNIQNQTPDGWAEIKWGTKKYFIRTNDIAPSRPLEVLFVDVGQGDGCIFTSAESGTDEKIIIIDAGESQNMFNFVKWRFGKLKRRFDFHAAIVTHPDSDHYVGFQKLFSHENVGFENVYHNGLMERTGAELLGPSDPSDNYLTDIIETQNEIETLYGDPIVRGGKYYPKLMFTAIESPRVGQIKMLGVGRGTVEAGKTYLPEFAPADATETEIRVIGPVPEVDGQGNTVMRWFGPKIGSTANDKGKTKNGHSVILKLKLKNFNLLFGGDLNRPAEDYLLRHYGQIAADQPLSDAIVAARDTLGAEMMKCCHHGASDVTNEFLQSVNAFAYVVSSGDSESHAHPRPDLLGRLGTFGQGESPMIFCTELLRSTRERGVADDFKRLRKLDKEIEDIHKIISDVNLDPQDLPFHKKALKDKRAGRLALQKHIEKRNVGVYGAITLRTDGDKMEISFRLETPRKKQHWQSFILEHDVAEGWVLVAGAGH